MLAYLLISSQCASYFKGVVLLTSLVLALLPGIKLKRWRRCMLQDVLKSTYLHLEDRTNGWQSMGKVTIRVAHYYNGDLSIFLKLRP